MIPSMVSRTCLATLVAWWGLMVLHDPWSAARAQEVTKPVAAKPEGESQAGETAEEEKSAAELAGMRKKAKALGEAMEAQKIARKSGQIISIGCRGCDSDRSRGGAGERDSVIVRSFALG